MTAAQQLSAQPASGAASATAANHWQSSTSDLRPETFFTWRALTRNTSRPRDSSNSNSVIRYTPVDFIATVSMPHETSQSAKCSRLR